MKRFVPGALLVGALFGGAPLWAQAQATASQKPAFSPQQAKFDDIVTRYNKQRQDAYDEYVKATDDAGKEAAIAKMSGKAFRAEFEALAAEFEGDEIAAQALLWVLRLAEGDKATMERAVQTLLEVHMESPALADLANQLRYADSVLGPAPVQKALRDIFEFSPHDKVRGTALYVLGCVLVSSAKTDAEKSEGRKCLEQVIAEFGKQATRSGTLGQEAEGWLYELDHLQLGMVAPDFEAVDENGAKWKLSDYRGKVVVVDFWGYW
jgi:hypothetical protein